MPVRYVMLAVVAVPLVAFLALAVGVVNRANDGVQAAQQAKSAGEDLTSATTLEAAVSLEHYWAAATSTVVGLGLDPAALRGPMGVDVAEEWRRAGVVVDGLQDSVASPQLRGILDGARARLDVSADGAYTQVGDLVAEQVDAATRALEAVVLRVDDPEAMVQAAAELTGAVRLRSDVFALVANLFGARFPEESGAARSITQLAAARVRYTDTIRALSAEDDPSPAFLVALRALTEQASTRSFLDAVDTVVAVPTPLAAQPDGPLDLAEQTASFNDSLLMVEQVGALVDTGSADLATTGEDLTATAEQTRLRVVAAVVLVGSVTIGIVALISQWLVRSLHGVSLSAGAMNEGDLDLPAAVRGPLEVRVAAQALNGASTNIRSAEQQVLALADGDLSAVERMPVPGRLGQSLDVAFARLADSLRDREELRAELHHEANYDGLTGLPNRSAVLKGLRAAVERSNAHAEPIAVLFVDIDGFKSINDQHGHGIGDEVLQGIAGRVRNAARSTDLVGSTGRRRVRRHRPSRQRSRGGPGAGPPDPEVREPPAEDHGRGSLRRSRSGWRWGPGTAGHPTRCSMTPTWRSTRPRGQAGT